MNDCIRPVREDDADQIADLRRMPGVFETILGLPSERSGRIREQIASLGRNDHLLVAVDAQGRVLGEIGLMVYDNPRQRHCAGLGMMVRSDYQGQGVGRALLESALDLADRWLMLERVELDVFEDHPAAMHLYQSAGFEIEGRKRRAAVKDGVYADEIMMARLRPQRREQEIEL